MVKTKEMKDKIKEVRLELGLNKKDFAIKLGVTKSSITFWENGSYTPTIENIKKIAKLCNKEIVYFTENIKNKDKEKYYIKLKYLSDFRNNRFIYEYEDSGYLYETLAPQQLTEGKLDLDSKEVENKYFIWVNRGNKYIVKRCSEYEGGAMYLVYQDYELKAMDLSDRKENGQSSNFRIVGKLLKLIRELD
jgi:DNA-binding XRE family transcriptional regulator